MIQFFTNRSIVTQLGMLIALLLVLWGYGISSMLNQLTEKQLETQAKTIVESAKTHWAWGSDYSGIWVKAGPDYAGSYIDRIDAGNGVIFYYKNPARVLKEISDKGIARNNNDSFRMVSLNPTNIENLATGFEAEAIKKLSEQLLSNKTPGAMYTQDADTFRYVEPVIHTQACLTCHGEPSKAPEGVRKTYGSSNGYYYKDGDVAGAISVTIKFDKWKILSSVINTPLTILIVLPVFAILAFVYWLSKKISNVATRIGSYQRGQSIGIDAKSIPENTHNEIFILVRAASKLVGIVNGTFSQLSAITKKDGKDSPSGYQGQ
jgi:hypothetical protein